MAEVLITEFTDPGCPFAFSAEPFRRRLDWIYGDQLEWRLRMVVLASTPQEYIDKGFSPERQSASFKRLAGKYGMPMDTRERPRMAATAPACRAVVATRLHAPALERALLRRLRLRHFMGGLLDDQATISAAADDAGVDVDALSAWMADEDVAAALQEDKTAARTPTDAALAQSHKLASWEGGMRYTCPSYEIARDGVSLSVPGFQPWAAYDIALANA